MENAGTPERGSAATVVALVASAGGLQAVGDVLARLPADLPAAVVVLIHQDPNRESMLDHILSRRTALDVRVARDGAELETGTVVVAPAGQHLLVHREGAGLCTALMLSGAAPPSRPSADLLLTTMAIAAGERAIATVLSGRGHDGATGATAIHRFGGTVIASDEAHSKVFSMPSATIDRDDAIDHVGSLEEIAALLVHHVGELRSRSSSSSPKTASAR